MFNQNSLHSAKVKGLSLSIISTWLGVYPILTLLAMLIEPLLSDHQVYIRTLVMSLLMVPMMVLLIMPLMSHLFSYFISPNQVSGQED